MRLETHVSPKPRNTNETLEIRAPRGDEGSAVWQLIKNSGSLDENSVYCNLLQCTHFASTCAVALLDGKVVGWVSGYIPPEEPDVLFIWQVCVSPAARGRGIGKKLIRDVLARDVCADVQRIKSTITDDNEASWALFSSVAAKFDAPLKRQEHFNSDVHFEGAHDTEHLVTIGPFESDDDALKSAA